MKKSKDPTSHCYWPADGWVIGQPNGEILATVPGWVTPENVQIEPLIEALDHVASNEHDSNDELPEDLRGYYGRSATGWRVHNGMGLLIAIVPFDTPNSEEKAKLVTRATNVLWALADGCECPDSEELPGEGGSTN